MKTIRSTIALLFGSVNPQDVLDNLFSYCPKDLSINIDLSYIETLFEANYKNYSHDEVRSIVNILNSKWSSYNDKVSDSNGVKSVFYTIQNFVSELLLEKDGVPLCEFEQLLRWREMSFELGENIFTTSFFAYKDLPSKRNRHFFSWQSIISTNNTILHDVLSQGCSELHFHLWGSSQNFDINWLCLMNNIKGRRAEFSNLTQLKHSQILTKDNQQNHSLYFFYVKAFAIRLFLFRFFIKSFDAELTDSKKATLTYNDYIEILKIKDDKLLSIYVSKLQSEVEWVKDLYGRTNKGEYIDYAIPKNISEVNFKDEFVYNVFHYGERWLLYKAFSIIYKNEERAPITRPLLYTYLIIQNRLRKEFIQLNSNTGFRNFQEYQDRKDLFISKYQPYQELLANIAVNGVLSDGMVKHLEVRITPQYTPKGIADVINTIDKWTNYTPFVDDTISNFIENRNNDSRNYKFHYVLHYIKQSESNYSESQLIVNSNKCRSFQLRNNIQKQTFAITQIRKMDADIKSRIVGIDAASSEIGCRPEVFAQAYRYLKNYSYETPNYAVSSYQFKQLGYTYHVGEDFLDIIDGLRAIDESILFLNLNRGDRLGHALALGTDVNKYYSQRENKIIISNQNLLDNIVWLLIYCKKNNINISSKLEYEINSLYHNLLHEIYNGYINHTFTPTQTDVSNNQLSETSNKLGLSGSDLNDIINHLEQCRFTKEPISSIPIDTYYQSWLLRGDNPELYIVNGSNIDNSSFLSFWNRCGLNYISTEILDARRNYLAIDLYIAYHYDSEAKIRGQKIREHSISNEYMLCVSQIQQKMRDHISKNHISIECNPTSNKLIGCISKYEKHPITLFSNLQYSNGGVFDFECNHISVSINTDDLGVFATSIENEYALLAIAMEKKLAKENLNQYSRRMIYDWLNRIRILGLEQRFHK